MNGAFTYLIVDDDADDREFFREAVIEINASSVCLMANNGVEALMKLRSGIKRLPDYIFLDLNMHLMDGRKCLAELKKDVSLQDIPVIILTTSSAQKDIDETRLLGAFYFLTKPSEYQKLRSEIIAVTQKGHSLQA